MKTRLSDIVSHLRNNYRKILAQPLQKCFLQCHFKMFLKPLSPFEEPKTKKKSVFQSEQEILPCFQLNYKFLERHKKPLSLAITRKQESKSSTNQDGEATTEEVRGSIVTYTAEEEIYTFKDDMASENMKNSTSTSVHRLQSWYLEKYKTELNLNSISKTFQGTYHISIATLNFQCFRLDTSFLSVLPPKR